MAARLQFADRLDASHGSVHDAEAPQRPRLSAILRHLTISLVMSIAVPSLLFYLCFRLGSVWVALCAALVWCYGTMAWRVATRRPRSGLLWFTVIGLTVKTALTFATGNTFIYFVQPAVSDGLISLVFLLSLATARPVVARLAGDFYPMDHEVASRPRVQQLFWRLTLFWAVLCLIRGLSTVVLLESTSLVTFIAAKSAMSTGIAVIGAACTVVVAVRLARREGLIHHRGVGMASPAA
jgi:hypothetical protein